MDLYVLFALSIPFFQGSYFFVKKIINCEKDVREFCDLHNDCKYSYYTVFEFDDGDDEDNDEYNFFYEGR